MLAACSGVASRQCLPARKGVADRIRSCFHSRRHRTNGKCIPLPQCDPLAGIPGLVDEPISSVGSYRRTPLVGSISVFPSLGFATEPGASKRCWVCVCVSGISRAVLFADAIQKHMKAGRIRSH
jgi:hypothetical protein